MNAQNQIISRTKYRKRSDSVYRLVFLKLFSIQKEIKASDKQRKKGQVKPMLD